MSDKAPTGPEAAIGSATSASPGNLPNPQDPRGVDVGFPAGAVDALRQDQQPFDVEAVQVVVSRQALDEVLAWVDRFAVRPIAGMEGREVVGSLSELRFDSDDPFLTSLDLVRVNGRPFVPETPLAIDDDVVLLAKAAIVLAHALDREPLIDGDPNPYRTYLDLRRRLKAGRDMDVLRAVALGADDPANDDLADEEVNQALEALRRWLEHDATCPAFAEPRDDCDCGLAEVVTALDPSAPSPHARRFTGPGELETSGYIESGPSIHGQPLDDGVEP
jgi:hypothetical protein